MTGREIRQYRKDNHLSQSAFATELTSALGVGYTTSLISYIESGIVDAPQNVKVYVARKIAEKVFRNPSNARLQPMWTTMPPCEKKSLKSAISKNWYDKGLTQNERVIAYIDEFGSITSKEAFDMIGVTRLASRICDLTKQGYRFERKFESADNRYGDKVRFTRYSFAGDGDGSENMA